METAAIQVALGGKDSKPQQLMELATLLTDTQGTDTKKSDEWVAESWWGDQDDADDLGEAPQIETMG